MKILYVITGLGVGGAERVVVDLADAFAGDGHEVKIAFLSGEAKLMPTRSDVEVTALGMSASMGSWLRGLVRLVRLIRLWRPDVVHSHMVHSNIAGRMARLFAPIPRLVSTSHNVDEEGRLRVLAYRLTHGLADVTTNVSQEAVAAFERAGAVPKGGMRAVYNGIRTERYQGHDMLRDSLRLELGIGGDCPLLLAVGRLDAQKDYPNLLKALSCVSGVGNWRLAVAGAGDSAPLVALAESLGIGDRVRFLGLRRDVPALMAACDVFVLSSAWEGFPMVVGEAMASGRMVVATDCGGVREFVGDTGLLCKPRDASDLARVLDQALTMTEQARQSRGAAARCRVEELYSHERALQVWRDLYQSADLKATSCAG